MPIDVQSKSKSLLGVSDLTLAATIRPGLIPALDSRSYESRLRLLLKTLNALRVSSLEAEPTPLIADAVDRIRAIHSFRLAIVGEEPPKRLLLAVAFDGGWEPYMRRIWRDLGPLLDVIFCNCEGYLDSYNHSFPAYANWVRSAQVETGFFYNASSLTVNDLHYLRSKVATDLNQPNNEQQHIGAAPRKEADREEIFKQALPALTALYRLTDMYPPPPGANDDDFLLRAARHLLGNRAECLISTDPDKGRNPTERAALRWFSKPKARPVQNPARVEWDPCKNPLRIQGGIVKPYEDATHACLLLVKLKDSAAARDMLEYLEPKIKDTSTAAARKAATATPFVNLGFTAQGLTRAGMQKGTFDLLPYEFREGMAARASILGDVRDNHPGNWSLPERNWPEPPQGEPERVELSSVHAIIQYTCKGPSDEWQEFTRDSHPLWGAVSQFDRKLSGKGVQILSVQCMRRLAGSGSGPSRDHFGFVDGISQPTLEAASQASFYSDEAVPGDLLLGYRNSLGDPPLNGELWDDSTFLVVRKLKQEVGVLRDVLKKSELKPEDAIAKFMGRGVDGKALIQGEVEGNDFSYASDPNGKACPFQAHIRRANPRDLRDDDKRSVPRIVRRGMSYGPRFEEKSDAERGLFFMAYNASIAEQFEVIQGWLSGSNSSNPDSYSALRDPFLGVPQDGDPHRFVFYDDSGKEKVVELPPDKPIVKLEWGLYAFVPSIKAIAELKEIADVAAKTEKGTDDHHRKKKEDQRALRLAMQARKGEEIITKLQLVEQHKGFDSAAEQWKIALEDISARMSGASQAVWAAIRELHGGVLRTPYGVLVCSKKLVNDVFRNKRSYYTVTGYAERMRASFGEIYLGKDDDELPTSKYRAEACPANKAIMKVTVRDAFESALKHTQDTLERIVPPNTEVKLEVKDIVDDILAHISNEWFGVPDGKYVAFGGWHWRRDFPTCPGHFHSPSRYMFQPNPGPQATLVGQQHGKELFNAVRQLLDAQRNFLFEMMYGGRGILGKALFDAFSKDQAQLTSTLIGVMMGFLPTVDGNIRGALYEWVNDRSLWDYQLDYLTDKTEDPLKKACRVLRWPLERTLLLRPVPELVWRTALERHSLGQVEVRPGDRIVVSIVSATHECLIKDHRGRYLIFGGKRSKKDHPTHACPGYKMAIGVMLGMLAGLLEFTQLRPTMSPLQLAVSLRKGDRRREGPRDCRPNTSRFLRQTSTLARMGKKI
ncbi:Dyp-type peroxidase [Bradyrhizobium sp. WSM 1738]|uniref:Dyp-type peroxidase domain-containing protein n=1 Tax=Bradyrhizobium hereditatis TaxID=2821405 RepID=UPI001CE28107|nr:Dyp-type peroxidase domain-containing protein [Bradyrhizobium hereditatis]MCA6118796.1 Dyp-type peroxidase [Bradyrhizobium hereditatis]